MMPGFGPISRKDLIRHLPASLTERTDRRAETHTTTPLFST
jgi:hypothetical protein